MKKGYERIPEITIAGKRYVDLALLETAIKPVYPLKTHSLRRLARYGKIPCKRIGMSRKDWFNIEDVKRALNLVIESDPNEINTENYKPREYITDESLASDIWSVSRGTEENEDYLEDL
jgi:hypothetical protein